MPTALTTLQQIARARIRKWLLTTDISQKELCARIGQNQPWLSRYLRGKIDADVDMLNKMAMAFGHTICALLSSPTDPEEAFLIEHYRALSGESRDLLKRILVNWSRPHQVSSHSSAR